MEKTRLWIARCLDCDFRSDISKSLAYRTVIDGHDLEIARAIRRHHEKTTGHNVNLEWERLHDDQPLLEFEWA